MSDNEYIAIETTFVCETEKAIMIDDGDQTLWIPKSQISNLEEVEGCTKNDIIEIHIPEWLAESNDLI